MNNFFVHAALLSANICQTANANLLIVHKMKWRISQYPEGFYWDTGIFPKCHIPNGLTCENFDKQTYNIQIDQSGW